MSIKIPDVLAGVLDKNPQLYGAVLLSVAEFEPLVAHSKTPFFPEYTDHGPQHLTDVLNTASSLIRDEAWPFVTAADTAALVLAVLLHDTGMHLTEDGFVFLLSGAHRAVPGWPEPGWPDLWRGFLAIASRFDARELNRLFGDSDPIKPPDGDPASWTLRDRQLIGEFVRRHHPRLAHETAIHGFPGPAVSHLKLKNVDPDLASLSGLISRSHGTPIRSALPYLKPYDVREYKGVHAPFIMALLRVADYLQVSSERAPKQVLSVRKLRSPFSQREWNAHHAVRDIRHTHEDPEAIFIDAAPADVSTFLRLRKLLLGLQEELDASWAVLGEVYGRYKGLADLGLTLRRVRSNIDDIPEFAKTVNYVPCHAAFDSAGPDLLRLLVKPLYGDRPDVGIRELIQNSVDACRELTDYLAQKPVAGKLDLTIQDADVVVRLENRGKAGHWLVVSDRGIGMTTDVVRGYFLKAGASFRRSDAWRSLHEDSAHKSRVLKSGRFGIGVLAAFLLGNEVDVSTRHISMPLEEGIAFSATIDTEDIELRRIARPVGTSIAVKIADEQVWDSLFSPLSNPHGASWDWYCLSNPTVRRSVIPGAEKLKQQYTIPAPGAELPTEWRRIAHADYKDIQWSYWSFPSLSCNGIRIQESQDGSRRLMSDADDSLYRHHLDANLALKVPAISVFDPDGHLPLVLQRNALATSQFPFEKELLRDVVRDWLAFTLTLAPTRPFGEGQIEPYMKWYDGVTAASAWMYLWQNGITPYASAQGGVIMCDPWLLGKAVGHKLLFIGQSETLVRMAPSLLAATAGNIVVPVGEIGGVQQYRKWIRFGLCRMVDHEFSHLMHLQVLCKRMVISRGEYDRITKGNIISAFLWSDVRVESHNDRWVSLVTGDCNCKTGTDFQQLSKVADLGVEDVVLIEWHLAPEQKDVDEPSPLAETYAEILGDPIIPYDPVERRKKFARAFESLKDYMSAHEQLRQKKDKKRKEAPVSGDDLGEES